MKRIIAFSILVIFAALGLGFTVLNADPVLVRYYFGSMSLPLALLVIASFIVGALAGVAASVGYALQHRREVGQLRRRVDVAEREVRNLRAIPIKDRH